MSKKTQKKSKGKPLEDQLEKLTFQKKNFADRFPSLSEELFNKPQKNISLNSFHNSEEELEVDKSNLKRVEIDHLEIIPTVYDFLQRCSTVSEAIEILDFLESRHEITKEEKDVIIAKIKTEGIRCFGKKREWGYYERTYRTNPMY